MNVLTMIVVLLLAGIGVVLFVSPHNRGYGSGASLMQNIGELFTEGAIETPGALVVAAVVFVGCVGVLLPALLALTAALVPDRAARGS